MKDIVKEIPKDISKVKSINSDNVDYYQWGLNCYHLDYDVKETEKIFNTMSNIKDRTLEDVYMFYSGYYQ